MTDVLHGILDRARADPDHPAVKDLERELRYGELRDEVAALAAGLRAEGVAAGDRVALLLPNSVDFVVAALACLSAGAIFVPLAVTDPVARLATIVADCAPVVVVVPDGPHGDTGPTTFEPSRLVAMSTIRGREDLPQTPAEPLPRLAYAIYTSGTTGTPKGVLISHGAFLTAVEATADALGLGQQTRTLCVSPFYFDGSFATLFPTLYSGGSVVIRPRAALLFPRTFFTAVVSERITYTGFSPSYLRLLLASPQMATLAGSALEIIALGGEAGSIADIRALWSAAPGIRVFNRYGPTETTIAVTHVELTPEMTADGVVPLGHPHPGTTFNLVDEDGNLVHGAGRIGELYIGGPQVMDGYWSAPALTAEVLRTDVVPGETVYRTGDLVYRDEAGRYVYADRADRVLKRSGVRISLVEVSEAVRGLPDVSAAACVAFDDGGEVGIVAFVVAEKPLAVLDLHRAMRAHLPDTMLPNRIELVDELPLTASSKLDERLLLDRAGLRAVGTPAAGSAAGPPGSAPWRAADLAQLFFGI
jgi:D-alanine--poly(phosphoribitol) ligase subunit 1